MLLLHHSRGTAVPILQERARVWPPSVSRHAETILWSLRVCADELSGVFFWCQASAWTQIAAVTFDLLDPSPICTEDLRSSARGIADGGHWALEDIQYPRIIIFSLHRTCGAFSYLIDHSWTQSWCRNCSKTDRKGEFFNLTWKNVEKSEGISLFLMEYLKLKQHWAAEHSKASPGP